MQAATRSSWGILQRGHPGGSESAVEGRWWLVVTFRQGAIARTENFSHRSEALEAAGLRELPLWTKTAVFKITVCEERPSVPMEACWKPQPPSTARRPSRIAERMRRLGTD